MAIQLHDIAGGKVFTDFFSIILPPAENLFVGNVEELIIKSSKVGRVKIISVRKFQVHQLRDFVCALDSGNIDVKSYLRKLTINHGEQLPDDDLLHVIVKYQERDFDALSPMITDWWQSKIPKP